jgi:hypothetical protein
MSALKSSLHELRIRYPIAFPVWYESHSDGGLTAFGRTLAITAKTVTFASDQDLRVGPKFGWRSSGRPSCTTAHR